ncbi:MAG: ISAs1 family transposase [Desulfitobacteriaceae bacterium]
MSAGLYKGKFFEFFGIIYDKRQPEKIKHTLIDVLFVIVAAVFCRIDELEEIYYWAMAPDNRNWLSNYVDLKGGIPSISTIRRIMNWIDPKQFEKCFISWVGEMTVFSKNGGDTVEIDGKSMRGSRNGNKCAHIVSAWCSANNLVLGQVKTDVKSNEITAIPELLDLLYLKGCCVTIDAMGCQRKIVKKIVKDKEADYVIGLKGNQGTLHDEVIRYFDDLQNDGELKKVEKGESLNEKIAMATTLDKGHGRIELRKYYYSTDIDWMVDAKKDWFGLTGIGMIYRNSTEKGKTTEDTRYFIGSIDNVQQFAKSAREHWGVESVHWNLDVTFRDDANKTRKDCAPENMAVAKRIGLNMVRNEKEIYTKESAKIKRLIASFTEDYRTKVFDLNFGRKN